MKNSPDFLKILENDNVNKSAIIVRDSKKKENKTSLRKLKQNTYALSDEESSMNSNEQKQKILPHRASEVLKYKGVTHFDEDKWKTNRQMIQSIFEPS